VATGYTRQSAASIVDGLTISAANHNNEFNQLESAFNGTTGHDHSGGSGLGPILLPPAVGMTSNGLYARTGASTVAARTITGSTGITVTDGDGVSGNPTLTLDAQLVDVAGLTPTDNGVIIGNGTNFVVESGATLKTSLGLTIGTNVQAWDADLDALAAMASTGHVVRTGSATYSQRTITGTAAEITVTNGSGVSGNPTLSLPTSLTFTGKTVTGGTFSSLTALSTAAATITGGSITGITDLAVADGGTGASTAAAARANLEIGWELLATTTVTTSATQDYETTAWFDGTYEELEFVLTDIRTQFDDENIWFRVKAGGSYQADAGDYNRLLLRVLSSAAAPDVVAGTTTRGIFGDNVDSTTTQRHTATIRMLTKPDVAGLQYFDVKSIFLNNNSSLLHLYDGYIRTQTAEAITGIRFGVDSTTFSARIRVYGKKVA
jgi:hypothetical protein